MIRRVVSTRICRPVPYCVRHGGGSYSKGFTIPAVSSYNNNSIEQSCSYGTVMATGHGHGNSRVRSRPLTQEHLPLFTNKILPLSVVLLLATATSFLHTTSNSTDAAAATTTYPTTESPKESNNNDIPAEHHEDDPFDHLPEEDDETTCTICLLNRQGPCRPYWRKLEWCMKHQEKKKESETHDEDDNNSKEKTTSSGEHCDKYMMPWLQCVQSYRNTYTVLMNQMYQQDFIDPVEASIAEKDRILFNKVHPDSFLDLDDWKLYKVRQKMDGGEETRLEKSEDDEHDPMDPPDLFLIAASAKVNLIDPATKRPVTIAYIRDQNGQVLGYDQFKKEKEERKKEHGALLDSDVASFTFYIDPKTTQSIQVFALYESSQGVVGDVGGDTKEQQDSSTTVTTTTTQEDTIGSSSSSNGQEEEEEDGEPLLSTLYYSNSIDL